MQLCPPPLPLLHCQLLRKCATHKNCHINSPTMNRNNSSGEESENTAREWYTSQGKVRHRELKVDKCGFIINPSFPELGATPDALVKCECCGNGCVEIKCPYKHRNNNLLQACEDDRISRTSGSSVMPLIDTELIPELRGHTTYFRQTFQ